MVPLPVAHVLYAFAFRAGRRSDELSAACCATTAHCRRTPALLRCGVGAGVRFGAADAPRAHRVPQHAAAAVPSSCCGAWTPVQQITAARACYARHSNAVLHARPYLLCAIQAARTLPLLLPLSAKAPACPRARAACARRENATACLRAMPCMLLPPRVSRARARKHCHAAAMCIPARPCLLLLSITAA